MQVKDNLTTEIKLKDSKATLWLVGFCLLFAIHFNIENTGGTGLELPYNSFVWIVVSLIFSASLLHLAKQRLWFSDTSLKIVGVIMAAITIPVIFQEALEPSLAGTRILGILAGLLLTILFFQSFQTTASWNTLLLILAGAGAIEAFICLIQQYLPELAAYGVYKADYGRPFGSFQQPNVSASFLATGLASSLYLTLTVTKSTASSILQRCLILPPLLAGIAIPLLGSRTGVIACLLVIIFALPLMLINIKNSGTRKPVLTWIAAALIGLAISFFTLQTMDSGGRNLESFQSTDNRQGIYKQAFDMIQEKPITGWGYGDFERTFLEYYAAKYSTGDYSHTLIANLDHPHNELLLWAIEGGVFPPLLLVILALLLIYRAIKQLGVTQGLAALSISIPLAFHSITEYPFYQSFAHWLAFSLIIAWLIWKGSSTSQEKQTSSFKLDFFAKCFAWITPIFLIPIMMLNIQANYYVTQYHAGHKQDISLLGQITHPSGMWKRFFFDVMTYRLARGLETKNREDINSYISWAEEFVSHTPRLAIYLNIANAYWSIGQPEKAISVLETATYLYPQREDVKASLQKTRITYSELQSRSAE